MRLLHGVGLALLLVVGAPEANAQFVDAPVGAIGGVFGGHHSVDPNRTTQSLETTFDLAGGYDSDPNLLLGTVGEDRPDLTRWYASSASGAARYRVGSFARSLVVRGRSFMNYQSNAGDSLVGGEGQVNGVARLGRRRQNPLSLELQASYEPGWLFGAFGSSLAGGPEDPTIGVATPFGVFEQRWLVMSGTTSYDHQWTPRHVTRLGYENRRLRPVDGGGLDSDWQLATFEENYSLSPSVIVIGSYRFDRNVQTNDGSTDVIEPVQYQTVDAGLRFERRLSPIRRYSVTARAGVTRLIGPLATRDAQATHPAFTATAELVPSRLFSLSAEYTRGVMMLAGISAVPVQNDMAEVSLNGIAGRRLRWAAFGSAARAQFLTSDPSRANQTDVIGTTAEVRYAFANSAAVFSTYGFYHHQIRDPLLAASGFPTRYDRHSFRIGLTLWVPLYGTF